MAAAPDKKFLLLLLPLLSLAKDSCMQEVLLLREQMEVEKVAMESKLDKMAASIERLEAEAKLKSAEMQAKAEELQAATARLVRGQTSESQAEVMVCSYRLSWTDTGTITYSKILTQLDNCDQAGGGCAAMDIGKGIFTALTPGMYSVTFSGRSVLYEGVRDKITLHLHHNGRQVTESLWQSYCGEGCSRINDQASRTLLIQLEVGDTVSLVADELGYSLQYLLFCVKLEAAQY